MNNAIPQRRKSISKDCGTQEKIEISLRSHLLLEILNLQSYSKYKRYWGTIVWRSFKGLVAAGKYE